MRTTQVAGRLRSCLKALPAGALVLFASACTSLDPVHSETHSIEGEGRDSRTSMDAGRAHQGVTDPSEVELILAIDRSRQPQSSHSGPNDLQGFFVGERSGCSSISVKNRTYGLMSHYDVCGDRIVRRQEIAPARPSGPSDRSATRSALQGALLYGTGESRYQRYRYEAIRLGVSDSQGCMPVGLQISFDGLLVDRQVDRVCMD